MKNTISFIFTSVIFIFFFSVNAQNIVFYHQINASDVSELNKLSDALHINGLNGWPVSSEEAEGAQPNITGIQFIATDTTIKNIGTATKYVLHYSVKNINLNSKGLTGSIPDLTFVELVGLNLSNNNISGSIPNFSLPKCQSIILNRNQLSGRIPALDVPELLSFDVTLNQLTGTIPEKLPAKLVNLLISDNHLEGPLPMLSLSELKYFMASRNNISGTIPDFNFPLLETLELEENQLTGTIPNFNFPKALYIRLSDNQLTGNIPDFNMPELSNLALGNNNLNGEIPVFNMPKLILLNVKNNQLEGTFNNSMLPILYSLYLQENNISGLPKLKSTSPNLIIADVTQNRLTFEDLEFNMDISQNKYNSQKTVPCFMTLSGANAKVWVEVGGSQNKYVWRKVIDGKTTIIEGENKKELIIPYEPKVEYFCMVTSDLVPNLSIRSEKSKLSSCIRINDFEFCIDSGTWDKVEGTNNITATNIISINNFLVFNGKMTIDTVSYELTADGEFYINNIPLPGGDIGKFTIAEGEHHLALFGNEGKIKNFLNSVLSKSAELFGIPLKIDDLQFFNRHDTLGIKLGCSAHIPWTSTGCGIFGIYEPGSDLKLQNLEISNKGILKVGFEVENIGLFKKDYCLKRITYEYNREKDVLTAGGEISLPFLAEIGGGFRIEKGEIDSVAWSIEGGKDALAKTLPLGFGTLGIKGCYGHISGLNQTGELNPLNMDIKLGGILSDITTDDLYRVTGDGRTIWPKLFEFSGSGKFFKPSEDFPFQIQGEASVSCNVPNNILEVSYIGNFLTADEQTWLATGSGGGTFNLSKEKPESEGYFSGDIKLPKLGDYWPLNWFNSGIIGTFMKTFPENYKIVHGVLYYYPNNDAPNDDLLFKVNYIINTEKQIYESGYLTFPEKGRAEEFLTKKGVVDNMVTKKITVPGNSNFGVFEVKSLSEAPVSSITSPSGKMYSTSSLNDKIIYSKTEDKKTAFWSILSPVAGDWQITIENPQINDSVISHFQSKKADFKFSMIQAGNQVKLNWDPAQLDSGQIVNFLFDTDNLGFNGIRVASSEASSGTLSIIMDENNPSCSYYLYAQVIDENGFIEVYADKMIENPLPALAPPDNLTSSFNSQSGNIDFSWLPSASSEIAGYILSVTDSEGNDSVYAVMDKTINSISVFVEDYQNKSAKIESFNGDWKIGCPAVLPSLITGFKNNPFHVVPFRELLVYPNPTNEKITIRFTLEKSEYCVIKVIDFTGRIVGIPVSEEYPVGTWEKEWNFGNLPNGIYLIVLLNKNGILTKKCVLGN